MSDSSTIALLTDFGTDDSYVAEMKGVILSLAPDSRLVDITHSVPPGDIQRAAYLLWRCHRWLPAGTIFLTVVDPGVGGDRRILLVQASRRFFIAPDNGLLTPIAGEHDFQAWELTNEKLHPEHVSCTFHGRDIMAPACAHLALGTFKPSDFGPRLDGIVNLESAELSMTTSSVAGRILTVDRFGNAITNIPAEELKRLGRRQDFRVLFGEHVIRSVSRTYSSVARGQMVAYIGSAGLLELAVNGGSLADLQGAGPGDEVKVEKHEP